MVTRLPHHQLETRSRVVGVLGDWPPAGSLLIADADGRKFRVRQLLAGANVTVAQNTNGDLVVSATGGGGGVSGFGFPLYAGKFYTNPFSVASSGVTVTSGVMQFHPLPAHISSSSTRVVERIIERLPSRMRLAVDGDDLYAVMDNAAQGNYETNHDWERAMSGG